MPSFSVAVDFEVFCGGCNAGLCNKTETSKTRTREMNAATVEPCARCLEDARKEGADEGYDRGKSEGDDEGYERGDADGYKRGLAEAEAQAASMLRDLGEGK